MSFSAWWRYAPVSRRQAVAGTAATLGSAPGNTGQAAQRPDQGAQPPTSAVAPSQAAGTLRARTVIVFGANGGVFVYDPAVTAGDLIASITDAATSPTGDTIPDKGIVSYVPGLQTSFAALTGGSLQLSELNLTAPATVTEGGAVGGTLGLSSGATAARSFQASIALINSATVQNAKALIDAVVQIPDQSSVPNASAGGAAGPVLFGSAASGTLRFVSDLTNGDGNTYDTARLTQFTTAAQTLSSTSFTALTGNGIEGVPVSAGKYYFEGLWRLKADGSSAAGNMGFTGPSATGVTWFPWASGNNLNFNDATTPGFNKGVQGSLTTANFLSTVAANQEIDVWFRGTCTFTAAGTFSTGGLITTGHTMLVQPGTVFEVRPVG